MKKTWNTFTKRSKGIQDLTIMRQLSEISQNKICYFVIYLHTSMLSNIT